MRKNENGRSMVEMLGVLAIIGVLSVGGIYGYTTAMRKYKANEIMQTAAMLATLARSANGGVGEPTLLSGSGLEQTPGGVAVHMCANSITNDSVTVHIRIPSDASNICTQINNIGAGQGFTVDCLPNDSSTDFTTCNANQAL
jgi:type II secretory pathway pseudopilin PulG